MKRKALNLLKKAAGEDAEFREDQWEAIEAALSGRKVLVVEKTGWGKSIVYFIATKILRELYPFAIASTAEGGLD